MKHSFVPQNLPLNSIDWIRFVSLIGQANAEIARYDGILQGIRNPEILLSPLTTREAVLSSKIEGTQASLEEVLEYEAAPNLETEKYDDIQEIINYRKAMRFAVQWLNKKPLTLNLIKEMHAILLDSVRGKDKYRGHFRTTQNYIGKAGDSIEKALFVPPAPARLMDALSNFEKYFHEDEKDRLVQLAVLHAQFEIIHPFLDGNGRIGRLLIPLFLFEKSVLNSPMFYISEYLEDNHAEYYVRLRAISDEGKWDDWIEFFLKAVLAQAKTNSTKAKAILGLYNTKKDRVVSVTHSQHAIRVLDAIFARPIFNSAGFIKTSGIPKPSALRLLSALKRDGIIKTIKAGGPRKPEVFAFTKLIQIVG